LIASWKGFILLGTQLLTPYFESFLSLVNLLESLSIETLMDINGFVAAATYPRKVLLGVSVVKHLRRRVLLNKL
jgi:hypothetical protein